MKATISVDHHISDGAGIVPFRVGGAIHAGAGWVFGESDQDAVVTKNVRSILTSDAFCFRVFYTHNQSL
jgi:hypothetical protein